MATVTTTVPKWKTDLQRMESARPGYKIWGRYKMEIINEIGNRVLVPFAPMNINHGQRGIEWSEVDRYGTYATFRNTGKKVPTLSFDLTLAAMNSHGKNNILGYLAAFDRMSEEESRVTINYTIRETGAWLLTSYSATVTHRDTLHRPTRADVSLTFSRIMDEKAFLGPIKGRTTSLKPPPPPKPKKTNTSPNLATYTVKKGDTLWAIAKRYYNNPMRWPKIADRNGVKNPKLLQIGTRLVIPRL